LALFGVDDAHRDFRIVDQCMTNAAGHKVTRQGGTVARGVGYIAKLQRELKVFERHEEVCVKG
jgi:hypothetical protein